MNALTTLLAYSDLHHSEKTPPVSHLNDDALLDAYSTAVTRAVDESAPQSSRSTLKRPAPATTSATQAPAPALSSPPTASS
jgi:hypothetical protein